jgi:hypothetical protein
MEMAIAGAVSKGGPILLDFGDVTFVDSTGIDAVLKALSALPSGCIVLHGGHRVQRVIDLMGVGQATNLHIHPCEVPIAA